MTRNQVHLSLCTRPRSDLQRCARASAQHPGRVLGAHSDVEPFCKQRGAPQHGCAWRRGWGVGAGGFADKKQIRLILLQCRQGGQLGLYSTLLFTITEGGLAALLMGRLDGQFSAAPHAIVLLCTLPVALSQGVCAWVGCRANGMHARMLVWLHDGRHASIN